MRDYEVQKINLLEAAVLVGKAIAGREEYVNTPEEWEGCVYSDQDDKPDCLIGWVLEHAGIQRPMNGTYANGVTLEMIHQGTYFDEAALKFLVDLQALQDQGFTWGAAVEQAISNVKYWVTV